MKSIILVALAVAAVAVAAPPSDPNNYETLRSKFVADPEGRFESSFETSNGIVRSETGDLKTVNDEDGKPRNVLVIRGSYAYPDENGKPIQVEFVADENGYQAFGDSIPKAVSRR